MRCIFQKAITRPQKAMCVALGVGSLGCVSGATVHLTMWGLEKQMTLDGPTGPNGPTGPTGPTGPNGLKSHKLVMRNVLPLNDDPIYQQIGWLIIKGSVGVFLVHNWWDEPLFGFRATKRELTRLQTALRGHECCHIARSAARASISLPFSALWLAPVYLLLNPVVGLACIYDAFLDGKEIWLNRN